MNKEKGNTMTPRLRFPDFRNAGEWEEKSFNQLLKIGNGKDYKHLTKGDIPVYGSGGYMLSVNEYLYEGESVCIGRKGTINNPIFLTGKFWAVDTLFYTHSFKDCLPKFIHLIFQNINWLNHNEAGGIPSLSKTNIEKIEVFIPKLNEQQKIAATLTTLDDFITTQTEKIKALQAHKKGLMQQLFPVEGERVPRVRFEEFRDAGEWEERTLGDENIARFVTKKTPLENLNLDSYISTENLLPDYGGVTPASKLPPSGTFTQFQIGDILISNIRPYLKKVWAAEKEGTASNDIIIIRAVSTINKTFLSFLLKNDCFITYVMGGAKGLKMPRGDKSLIKEYRIGFPEKAEQQKIAATLSSLDDLITAQTQKLEALKAHKKGLMQGLFVEAEGVESRI